MAPSQTHRISKIDVLCPRCRGTQAEETDNRGPEAGETMLWLRCGELCGVAGNRSERWFGVSPQRDSLAVLRSSDVILWPVEICSRVIGGERPLQLYSWCGGWVVWEETGIWEMGEGAIGMERRRWVREKPR